MNSSSIRPGGGRSSVVKSGCWAAMAQPVDIVDIFCLQFYLPQEKFYGGPKPKVTFFIVTILKIVEVE